MARPPKGKPLTLRPIRLDDDVWAECQRLGKEHGTINEGISAGQAALRIWKAQATKLAEMVENSPNVATAIRGKSGMKRGPRQKGR